MIKVYNKDTGELLGRITEAELQFLVDNLEEERLKDQDYYMTRETIDGFAASGASAHLIEVLRAGLRNDAAIEIRWEKE